jgi:hypothetical protein
MLSLNKSPKNSKMKIKFCKNMQSMAKSLSILKNSIKKVSIELPKKLSKKKWPNCLQAHARCPRQKDKKHWQNFALQKLKPIKILRNYQLLLIL